MYIYQLLYECYAYKQQNSYSNNHYSVLWLHGGDWTLSDNDITIANCRQHGDYTAIGISVTMLLAVSNSDTVTVQPPYNHCDK